MTDTPPESSTTDLSFDAALARLDEVVRRLEDGSVELEEAIHLFEEGTRYVERCRERLNVAQARIEELTATGLPTPPPDAGGGNADAESSEPF